MEIDKPTIEIFYLSRVFGLAPYLISKNSKGKMLYSRSKLLVGYSVVMITVLVALTYRGLIYDASSEVPIRMNSATSKVVTALDVSIVVFACLAGVICGFAGLKHTQDMNRRLAEADEMLMFYTNKEKDKRRGYLLMLSVLLAITLMLCLDVWSWHRMAKKLARASANTELNVQWYIPFYSLYYILMGLHIHFAQSALGLGRRYRRLNMALRSLFQEDGKMSAMNDKGRPTERIPSLSTVSRSVDILSTTNLKKIQPIQPSVKMLIYERNTVLIDRLAYIHSILGKAMQNISGAFGLAVLFILGSCLLHLVATSYFLFLQLLGDKDIMFSWLQFLWLLFHIMRLLLVVEPCHVTAVEAKKTISMICELQRNFNDNELTESLRKFWQQLLSDRSDFSACGMCKIDRQILTSFSGAIATYLVILIQFQKTDG